MTLNRFITKITDNKVGLLISFFTLFSLSIIGLYAIKHFGTQYTEQKVQEQLKRSGLAPFVRYQSIHFNPFTLTPSLENVSFGYENAPWLRFARISFNRYPITYPSLDIDFWLKASPASSLSRETAQWMHAAGIETLVAKGSFVSKIEPDESSTTLKSTSQLTLNVKEVGRLSFSSKIALLDTNLSMTELRTDLLASIALGQPEAIFIIHGDHVEINDVDIRYQDAGMIKRLFPNISTTQTAQSSLLKKLQTSSQSLGFAHTHSVESKHIADTILTYLQSPTSLHLAMPSSSISLKDVALMINDNTLYQASKMTLSTAP